MRLEFTPRDFGLLKVQRQITRATSSLKIATASNDSIFVDNRWFHIK
jgi:hypothetical protein